MAPVNGRWPSRTVTSGSSVGWGATGTAGVQQARQASRQVSLFPKRPAPDAMAGMSDSIAGDRVVRRRRQLIGLNRRHFNGWQYGANEGDASSLTADAEGGTEISSELFRNHAVHNPVGVAQLLPKLPAPKRA